MKTLKKRNIKKKSKNDKTDKKIEKENSQSRGSK
jgi:hypothetical protein